MIQRSGSGAAGPEVVFTAPIDGVYVGEVRGTLAASTVVGFSGIAALSSPGTHKNFGIVQLDKDDEVEFSVGGGSPGAYDVTLTIRLVGGPDLAV